MTSIIGSIDNAAILNTQYYLIFTESEVLQFEMMSGKERRRDIYTTQMSNSLRMVPVAGEITTYNVTKEELIKLVDDNISRGKEIEQNIENILKEQPPKFVSLPYGDIHRVELSNGTPFTLPHLIMDLKLKKLKFHLVRKCYEGRGKLPDEVFNSYESTLKEAFGDIVSVKD